MAVGRNVTLGIAFYYTGQRYLLKAWLVAEWYNLDNA